MNKKEVRINSPWGIIEIDPSPEAFEELELDIRVTTQLFPLGDKNEYGKTPVLVLGVGIMHDPRGRTVIWGKQNEEIVFFYPEQVSILFKTG
jgi:hypothetical protein